MLLLRRNNESRKIYFSIQILPKSSQNLIFYAPKVEEKRVVEPFFEIFRLFWPPSGGQGRPWNGPEAEKKGISKNEFFGTISREMSF